MIELRFLEFGGRIAKVVWLFKNVRRVGQNNLAEPIEVWVLGYIQQKLAPPRHKTLHQARGLTPISKFQGVGGHVLGKRQRNVTAKGTHGGVDGLEWVWVREIRIEWIGKGR
jgi:hypothetical protein